MDKEINNQISYVSEEGIQKYQELWLKHFNEQINKQDAQEGLIKLVRLMSIVYEPMTEAQLEQVKKRRKELGVDV